MARLAAVAALLLAVNLVAAVPDDWMVGVTSGSIPGCASVSRLDSTRCMRCDRNYDKRIVTGNCGCPTNYGSYVLPATPIAIQGQATDGPWLYPWAAPACPSGMFSATTASTMRAALAQSPATTHDCAIATMAGTRRPECEWYATHATRSADGASICGCFPCPPGYSSMGGEIPRAACVPNVLRQAAVTFTASGSECTVAVTDAVRGAVKAFLVDSEGVYTRSIGVDVVCTVQTYGTTSDGDPATRLIIQAAAIYQGTPDAAEGLVRTASGDVCALPQLCAAVGAASADAVIMANDARGLVIPAPRLASSLELKIAGGADVIDLGTEFTLVASYSQIKTVAKVPVWLQMAQAAQGVSCEPLVPLSTNDAGTVSWRCRATAAGSFPATAESFDPSRPYSLVRSNIIINVVPPTLSVRTSTATPAVGEAIEVVATLRSGVTNGPVRGKPVALRAVEAVEAVNGNAYRRSAGFSCDATVVETDASGQAVFTCRGAYSLSYAVFQANVPEFDNSLEPVRSGQVMAASLCGGDLPTAGSRIVLGQGFANNVSNVWSTGLTAAGDPASRVFGRAVAASDAREAPRGLGLPAGAHVAQLSSPPPADASARRGYLMGVQWNQAAPYILPQVTTFTEGQQQVVQTSVYLDLGADKAPFSLLWEVVLNRRGAGNETAPPGPLRTYSVLFMTDPDSAAAGSFSATIANPSTGEADSALLVPELEESGWYTLQLRLFASTSPAQCGVAPVQLATIASPAKKAAAAAAAPPTTGAEAAAQAAVGTASVGVAAVGGGGEAAPDASATQQQQQMQQQQQQQMVGGMAADSAEADAQAAPCVAADVGVFRTEASTGACDLPAGRVLLPRLAGDVTAADAADAGGVGGIFFAPQDAAGRVAPVPVSAVSYVLVDATAPAPTEMQDKLAALLARHQRQLSDDIIRMV